MKHCKKHPNLPFSDECPFCMAEQNEQKKNGANKTTQTKDKTEQTKDKNNGE